MMSQYDPVDLGIMWDRLISITDEMITALIRTSFSLMVREVGDLSCVLFDAKGRSPRPGQLQSAGVHRHRAADHPPHAAQVSA